MTLPGLDISQYQSTTPPLKGFAFVFARATYNLTPDTRYGQHMAAAKAAGIIRGAYHFGTGAATPQAQASAFLNTAGDAQILCLDLENDAHPMTTAQAAAFIAAVKAGDTLHRKVGLYHSASGFPQNLGQDFNWVASWTVIAPGIPWAFWQRTSSGSVPGYVGRLDLDTWAGDLTALNRLAGIVAPVRWSLVVSPGATVQVATVVKGVITDWTPRPTHQDHVSTAPCYAPRPLPQSLALGGGKATVVWVPGGAFAKSWVHAGGPGVTTSHM